MRSDPFFVGIDLTFNCVVDGERIFTYRVVLGPKAEAAIARGVGLPVVAVSQVLHDEIQATVNALVDKGNHGMQADEMIADGSIEVGRPPVF
jgi:hypothetical protein